MLNRRAGMLGLGGEIDFRVLHQRIESGDAAAQLAYDVYIHRLRKYIGGLPGGAGHRRRHHLHRRGGRERRCRPPRRADRYDGAGYRTRRATQHQSGKAARGGSRPSESPTTVLVIPTDEELAIARACADVVEH